MLGRRRGAGKGRYLILSSSLILCGPRVLVFTVFSDSYVAPIVEVLISPALLTRPISSCIADDLQFFGFSIASAYASYYLLQEYKVASSLLQGSVEELQESTVKVSCTALASDRGIGRAYLE
jgi:hypothetical protein